MIGIADLDAIARTNAVDLSRNGAPLKPPSLSRSGEIAEWSSVVFVAMIAATLFASHAAMIWSSSRDARSGAIFTTIGLRADEFLLSIARSKSESASRL